MRRIALVLTAAVLMAVLILLSAGPATADVLNSGNTGGWANQQFVVSIGNDDYYWHGGSGGFDSGDIDLSNGDIEFS